jgi:hypothetical protein
MDARSEGFSALARIIVAHQVRRSAPPSKAYPVPKPDPDLRSAIDVPNMARLAPVPRDDPERVLLSTIPPPMCGVVCR